jgi:iron complex outermembrane receptor protein
MKTRYFIVFLLLFALQTTVNAQNDKTDSIKKIKLSEVIITSPRTNVPLNQVPSSISIVSFDQLNRMGKSIAADEALRLVPGIKIDNGTGGSRVHLYIRGQGVLSERGFRGIGILIDGITINDPGGYAPDLYDVDWATVKNVEVIKGLAASMYGGCANGGVVNITTIEGGPKPVNVTLMGMGGSYGYMKTLAQIDGTKDKVNYRISYSHNQGFGYRVHQAFRGDNFSKKLTWSPTNKVKITQLLSFTTYFNQNSDGINLGRYDTVGYQAANTDAIPFNEFQKTQRLTGATIGKFGIGNNSDIQFKVFFRYNNYKETSNNNDDNRPFTNEGFSLQYNIKHGKDNLVNHISLGTDLQTLTLNQVTIGVKKDENRIDSHFSEEVFDTGLLLRNQRINQRGAGFFFIDKLDIASKLFATVNVRYDYIYNQLIDNLLKGDSCLSGSREFSNTSYRLGLAYDISNSANIYVNYGTGFLAPTNDELYNNPVKWGGFNQSIKPSTSMGGEIGVRGDISKKFYYDITAFSIDTKNEFYRYREPWMGNTSAVFGNIGQSKRIGVETYFSYSPIEALNFDIAYTYSNFKYVSPDSVKDHWIPQCPQHILSAEVSLKFLKHFTLALGTQYQSQWYIQVDDSIYNQFNENGVLRNSYVDGFTIYNADLSYEWKIGKLNGDLSFFAKNILDEHYFGFTEPNNGPDYNSFQAAPGREFFVRLRLRF